MIKKTKKSISLSNSILEDLASINRSMSISQFVETAVVYYINELKRQERIQKDIQIIYANSKRFSKEAIENLEFQDEL